MALIRCHASAMDATPLTYGETCLGVRSFRVPWLTLAVVWTDAVAIYTPAATVSDAPCSSPVCWVLLVSLAASADVGRSTVSIDTRTITVWYTGESYSVIARIAMALIRCHASAMDATPLADWETCLGVRSFRVPRLTPAVVWTDAVAIYTPAATVTDAPGPCHVCWVLLVSLAASADVGRGAIGVDTSSVAVRDTSVARPGVSVVALAVVGGRAVSIGTPAVALRYTCDGTGALGVPALALADFRCHAVSSAAGY